MMSRAQSRTRSIALYQPFCAVAVLLAGCSGGDNAGSTTGNNTPGCIAPGNDDQTAVQTALIEVKDGGTVCLTAGTFRFTGELSLAVDNVIVRGEGQDKTILDFSGQTSGGNGLQITSDGVTVEKLAVRNTPGDGIRATSVKDISFLDVTVGWDAQASLDNGAYGLYPVQCDGVRVERCIVHGARDAGIYVGQSTRILVANSEAFGNVAGCEIENSTDSEVRDNYFHDNTGGFLAFNLPNLPVQDGKRAKVHHNRIENNNLANFAEMGTKVAMVASGSGIVILASDGNEFHDNEIKDNKSTGIMILSYSELLFGMVSDPNFNQYPESNFIHHNTFTNNGTDPDPAVEFATGTMTIEDVIWDGCVDAMADNSTGALTNCMFENGTATYKDFTLCGGMQPATDLAAVTCEHTPLAAQNP
jgi:parallel beta-helix repeat protein